MANHWVCKPDGAIQCQEIAPVSLEEMRKQLALIVGDENIVAQTKKHVIVPQLCGLPAGSLNAYELNAFGYYVLVHGFVGRMGFGDCDVKAPSLTAATVGEVPIDFATALAATSATSAGANPVLVRELIGHVVRVYEQGDAITKDYRPERVNVVTGAGRIADIWFG